MNTKLTLRLNDELIEHAKQYAKLHHTSVSQLVAEYFLQLQKIQQQVEHSPLPSITQQLSGILKEHDVILVSGIVQLDFQLQQIVWS